MLLKSNLKIKLDLTLSFNDLYWDFLADNSFAWHLLNPLRVANGRLVRPNENKC